MTSANARATSSGFGDFFKYHGWLAPGVRQFRKIGFRAKALWISAAFMVPLIMSLYFMWSAAQSQIEFARSERQGITYVQPLLDLIQAARDRRVADMTGGDIAGANQKVSAAFTAVQERQTALGKTFGVSKSFDELRKAHEDLLKPAPATATPDERFAAHNAMVDAILALVREVADGSQLVLDPDLDTFHMMTMSVLRGPGQVENTARLRDLGSLVLETKQLTPTRHDTLMQGEAIWDYLESDVENAYQKGISTFPEVDKQLDMKGTDAAADAFRAHIKKLTEARDAKGDRGELLSTGDIAVQRQNFLVREIIKHLDRRLKERVDHLTNVFATQLAVAAFFVFIAAYLMLAFYKVMMGGLQEVAGHLKEISLGNLGTAPSPWGKDEAAQVMLTLREMQLTLRRVVSTVLDSASQVRTASQEISTAAHDLARRTELSVSTLEETAASTQQISSAAQHTTDTVDGAMALVDQNAASATRGGEVINQVVHTMSDIQTSSNKIGEIIGVIDGIAFQTNILALNAAVEAARAGDQGRGFAVVAAEVRALAGRSAAAAKEIKTLISASIEQVENGNRIAADAGATIRDIVSKADSMATMMKQISSASREQTNGVGEVGVAVRELDKSTQQNAALVEQTAAATSALSEQAGKLADVVGFFRIPAGKPGGR